LPITFGQTEDLGACDQAEYNRFGPNANTVAFVSDWGARGSDYVADAYGVTLVWHNPDTGEILDADIHVNLSREDVVRLVQALAGLTVAQTRRVIAQAILEDGQLSPLDIERVIRWKGEILERGGILEFFPAGEHPYELGGFARLKAWLEHGTNLRQGLYK
jgi:hypothetical protein